MSTQTQSVEDANLKALGAIKSNYALIDLAASQIENRLLLNDEVLNDNPASFMNIFLENFGRIGSQAFYEQMMYKNEMHSSTAIKLRSLMNKLKATDIPKIYAYPSRMTFVVGYSYDKIVELAIANGNQIVLNKESKFSMSGQETFVLDHNVIIKVANPGSRNQNVYAIYDTSDKLDPNNTYSEVNNIYITSQVFNYEGTKVFGMFLNCRQLERHEEIINITTDNPDFELTYSDQLYGFELGHKSNNEINYSFKNGLPDGNSIVNGYNYNIDTEEGKLGFSFNRNPEYWTPAIGDNIKVIMYTTLGSKGNFKVANMYEQFDQIAFEYSQNRDDPQQDCISFIQPFISIKDAGASNGKDALSFNAIKALVIERGSNPTIWTPGDLEKRATGFGFAVNKIRSDVRCLEYRAAGVLQNGNDILSSIDTTISFNFDDIPINREVDNRILTPKMAFEINRSTNYCEYVKEQGTYEEYFKNFRDGSKNQYLFPYHIRFSSNTGIDATVFNMNRDNESYNLKFDYYNDNTSFESSIINVIVNRDPVTERVEDIPDNKPNKYSTGFYDISFQITASATVVENLYYTPDDPIIKYRVVMNDGERDFLVDSYIKQEEIDLNNNTIMVHAVIKTDDAISNANRIIARDYCVQPIPYVMNPIEFYFLSENVNLKIYVIEKNLNGMSISTPHDVVLTENEKNDLYFISTVYSADSIKLFENYSDYINLQADLVVNQREYARYEKDVYKTYQDDELLYDEFGNPVNEIVRIPVGDTFMDVSVAVVLNKRGSFVYKESIEMSKNELIDPIHILTDIPKEELSSKPINVLTGMIEFNINKLSKQTLIKYLDKFLGLTYTIVVDNGNEFLIDEEGVYITDLIKESLQSKLDLYRIKVILFKKGDIDQTAAFIKDETYTALIKHIPLFDRIYGVGTGYRYVIDSYEALISNLKVLRSSIPDGASISIGIKNTSGRGDYEVYNMSTSTWQDIDNISLSFDIGIKYLDNANNDDTADSAVIVETIREYINNFDEVSFSINNIFELVKNKLPSIEYMILYKINQYSPAEVQSIRKKDGNLIVPDKLSVRQIIDTETTDLDKDTVNFKSDITVRKIT
ncbi:MAG: hypothetical protein ACRC5M_04650 [Anaeroplasmataceae bacterium]